MIHDPNKRWALYKNFILKRHQLYGFIYFQVVHTNIDIHVDYCKIYYDQNGRKKGLVKVKEKYCF